MLFKLKILYYYTILKTSKYLFKDNISYLQQLRWKLQAKRLLASPFYSKLLKNSKKLQDLPIMNKELFMKHFDEINTCGIHLKQALQVAIEAETSRDFNPSINGITVGLSTGTSGNRGCFLVSENERALWVACVMDRVIGLSFKKRKVAFFMRANSNLYQSVKSKLLSFHFFDILKNNDENIKQLHQLQPDILVGQPSLLTSIAREFEERKINITPKKIISIAEVLTPENKNYLEKVFNQKIHQVYQCTEGFLASTCDIGTLHFNEDFLIIEKKFIDDKKTKFHPVITDLFRICQPVIRYELNDVISIKEDCDCKSNMLAIEQIEGRADDVFRLKNKNHVEVVIFPDAIRKAIVISDENIKDYSVILSSPKQIELFVLSKSENSYMKAKRALTQLLLNYEINEVSIQRSFENQHVLETKKRRIKNEISK